MDGKLPPLVESKQYDSSSEEDTDDEDSPIKVVKVIVPDNGPTTSTLATTATLVSTANSTPVTQSTYFQATNLRPPMAPVTNSSNRPRALPNMTSPNVSHIISV